MALVRFPEGQQRSGSVGGATYSHNRYGAYIRARSVPVNPNTDRQVAVRNAVRSLAIAWSNTLTPLQRSMWDEYGLNVNWTNKFGEVVNLPGLNHFIRCNTPRVQNGIARVDDAPIIYTLATAELQLAATASEATQDLTIDVDPLGEWVGEADAYQFFYQGAPQNPSINFFGGPFRLLVATAGTGVPVLPVVAPAVFPFAAGHKIWIQSRIARGDGRLSDFAQVSFLAAV